jgi:hypothetical protein
MIAIVDFISSLSFFCGSSSYTRSKKFNVGSSSLDLFSESVSFNFSEVEGAAFCSSGYGLDSSVEFKF